MLWVNGINSGRGKLILSDGSECDIQELHLLRINPSLKLRKVVIQSHFESWRRVSDNEIEAAMGCPLNQMFYEFVDNGERFWIPAQVLIPRLINPWQRLWRYALSAAGIDGLCVPATDLATGLIYCQAVLDRRELQRASIQQPLLWASCFPSARNAWNSLYYYATHGQLGIDLPQGRAKLVCHVIRFKGILLVLEMSINSVYSEEFPFSFAHGSSRMVIFRETGGGLLGGQVGMEDRLPTPRHSGDWALTDEEWTAVEPIFRDSIPRPYAYDTRQILDVILYKLGQRIAWRDIQPKLGNWSTAHQRYREYCKSGKWQAMLGILSRFRDPREISVSVE